MQRDVEVAQSALLNHVSDTLYHYRLICDYFKRPIFVDKMGARVKALNQLPQHVPRQCNRRREKSVQDSLKTVLGAKPRVQL